MLRSCAWQQIGPLLFWLVPSLVAAQATTDTIKPGMRVRVTIDETTRPAGTHPRTQLIRGTLASTPGDSIVIRPSPTAGTLALPRISVHRVDVSLGTSRARSALVYALRLAFAGAVICASENVDCVDERRRFRSGSESKAAAFGAVTGALVGGTLGVLMPYERWRRGALSTRVSLVPQAN